MLRVTAISIELVRDVCALAASVAVHDRDEAAQLRRAVMSVAHNLAEGSGCRGGKRRSRYEDALGSAREVECGLACCVAAGYVPSIDDGARRRLDAVIGTLVRVLHPRRA